MNTSKDSAQHIKKVIAVTGVSRGIGREIFLQCAADPEIIVVGVSRNQEQLDQLSSECTEAGSGDFHLFGFDITNETLNEDLREHLKSLGQIDVLIHNAGALVNKPFQEITYEDWLKCYRTNVYGPFRYTQLLMPWLMKSPQAHIVNIGSMGGIQGSAKFPGLSAYSSSKAALIGWGECLAEELKEKNIRVNTVNLGSVQTEMLAEAFPGFKAAHGPTEVAKWLIEFGLNSGALINGKSVQLSDSTP